MHWLLVVHSAPDAMSSQAAQQLSCAALADGVRLTVFFHADGVYHALPVAAMDPGLVSLHERYSNSAASDNDATGGGLQLLVCRASLSRRSGYSAQSPWQSSSLIQLAELLQDADRVISFVD
jgi:sulfur relay (sulfurtransferase) complex TusBCD TusD component (DsrE family)